MSSFSVIQLEIELMDAGKRLLLLPSSTPELLNVLAQMEQILSEVQQLPSESMKYTMHPIIEAIIAKELVSHTDMDVNISVACCICEIFRIMAPNSPYNDDQMKEFFELATMTFEKLSSASGGCYTKMTKVLKTFSSVARLLGQMLDLQLDELLVRMFKQFFTVADSNSSDVVLEMEKIMTMIIEESQKPTPKLVGLLITSVRTDNQIASPICWKLGQKILKNCAVKLKVILPDIVRDMGIDIQDYSKMVAHICNGASENEAVVPMMKQDNTSKLKKDTTHKRKLECTEENRNSRQMDNLLGIHSEHKKKHEKKTLLFSDDPIIPSKSETEAKGKKQKIHTPLKKMAQPVELGKNLVGTRIEIWKPLNQKNTLLFFEDPPLTSKSEKAVKGKHRRKSAPLNKLAAETAKPVKHGENLVGSRIKVLWPLDKIYYEGVVASFNKLTSEHKVCYTDGEEEILNLKDERWEFVENVCAKLDSPVQGLPRKVSSPQSGVICVQGYEPVQELPRKVSSPRSGVICVQGYKELPRKVSSPQSGVICVQGYESSQELPRKVSSPGSGVICVQGYEVKHSVEPILQAIFKKHGDIAAECLFKTASVRASFLEVVCEVVRRIESGDITTVRSEMEKIENEISEAEAANINVSWLRAHLEALHKRKECSLLMDLKAKTTLVKRAAQLDLKERRAELMTARKRFERAQRCVKVLDLVETKLHNNILESKIEENSWAKLPIL